MGSQDSVPCRKLPSWDQCPACLRILLSSAWPLWIETQLGFACSVLGVCLYWLWSNSVNQALLLEVGRGEYLLSCGKDEVAQRLGPGPDKTPTYQDTVDLVLPSHRAWVGLSLSSITGMGSGPWVCNETLFFIGTWVLLEISAG